MSVLYTLHLNTKSLKKWIKYGLARIYVSEQRYTAVHCPTDVLSFYSYSRFSRIEAEVGMPVQNGGYQQVARTAIDGKNTYWLPVLYTQLSSKSSSLSHNA